MAGRGSPREERVYKARGVPPSRRDAPADPGTDGRSPGPQVATTKGTGGDIIILEEAAYIDPGFFYETVAPLLIMGDTSLLAISTLREEVNFYTRLMRMRDRLTSAPLFTCLSVQLACKQCIADGKPADCVHMLHLVPR